MTTMTRTPLHGSHEQAIWHIVVTTYGCSTCGAPPGQPCHTSSGRVKTTEVHVARSSAASARHWLAADVACDHCKDDPPAGHTCPRCGAKSD